ncbi:hypothetical protein P9112_006410 [Eukaryota sp. TZLM1-RC]
MSLVDHELRSFLENHLKSKKKPEEMHNTLFRNTDYLHLPDPSEQFRNEDAISGLKASIKSEQERRQTLEKRNFFRNAFLRREVICLNEQLEAFSSAKKNIEKQMIAELELQSFIKEIHLSKLKELSRVEQRYNDLEMQKAAIEEQIQELKKRPIEEPLKAVKGGVSLEHIKELEEKAERLRREVL